MANQKIVLAQLDIDVKSLVAAAKQSADAIAAINKELEKLTELGEDSSDRFEQMQEDVRLLTLQLQVQNEALEEQVRHNFSLADAHAEVIQALHDTTNAQKALAGSMAGTDAATAEYAENAAHAAEAISELNKSLTLNNNLMADNDAAEKQVKTFNDYKEQVTKSFDSINIFNGGLGGLISRAQEAGGAGPLVKGAFEGISQGIMGMTKSSLAFIATPIGAVIAAVGLVVGALVSYFKDTQEGIDKVTAVTRPLQSVFSALMGVFQNVGKYLADAFTNPQQAISDFGTLIKENIVNRFTGLAELVPNLAKSVGLLFEGKFGEAGKVATDALGKVALGTENITDKIVAAANETGVFLKEAYERGQKIDQLQKNLDKGMADYTRRNSELTIELDKQNTIADDANATFGQREAAAIKAIAIAKEHNKLLLDRMDSEIELLKIKQQDNGISDAEKKELAEMVAKRNEAAAQQVSGERAMQDKLTGIRKEAAQKRADAAIARQKQLLDVFVAEGDARAKSLADELKYEEDKAAKSIAILKRELDAKKITRLEHAAAVKNIETQTLQNTAKINSDFAKVQIELWVQQNKNKLEGVKTLNQDLITAENDRLKQLNDKELQMYATQNGLNIEKIRSNAAKIETMSLAEQQFYAKIVEMDENLISKQQANNAALQAQKDAEEARIAGERAEKSAMEYERNTTEYQQKIDLEDKRLAEERAKYDQWELDGVLTHEEAEKFKLTADENSARVRQQLAIQNMQTQLGTMQSVAGAIGEAFGQSKELALAQATMNAGQAILSIWSGTITANPLLDTVIKGALTASTAVKTAKQIKEIQSAKKPKQPKFAQGGLMAIGGKRHSAGGTTFAGSDGTRFEAEQGELIGIMNRNAAAHFMAFNNAFPSGGSNAPNYFAGGGIVSREMAQQSINIDELAAKIALANRSIPAPVVAVQDIITQGNSYVQVRDAANF